jgi:hypothetical protein
MISDMFTIGLALAIMLCSSPPARRSEVPRCRGSGRGCAEFSTSQRGVSERAKITTLDLLDADR